MGWPENTGQSTKAPPKHVRGTGGIYKSIRYSEVANQVSIQNAKLFYGNLSMQIADNK